MRLLILGSGGKLGAVLRRAWPDCAGIEPIWHSRTGGDVSFDIFDHPALSDAISRCDAVFLLAGVTRERPGRPLSLNTTLARATLDASQGKPVFLSSSAAVYGDQPHPLSEQTALRPVSAYGRAKVEMEGLAAEYPNAFCLRIGNVAGADALLGQGQRAFTLDQFEDGSVAQRSYIGPHALAVACSTLVQTAVQGNLPKLMNIACPNPLGLNELLRHAGLTWTTTPAPAAAIKSVHLDTTRLQSLVPITGGTAQIVADWQKMEQNR